MLTEYPMAASVGGMSKPRTMPAEQLRAIREEIGIIQAEMAERFNVARESYVRWETGVRKIAGPAVVLAEMLLKQHRDAQKLPG